MNGPSDDEAELFLKGGSASFALAVWEASGRPDQPCIWVVADGEQPEVPRRSAQAPVHAYLHLKGRDIDVAGVRDSAEMADDFALEAWHDAGPYTVEEFFRLFVTGKSGGMTVDREDVAIAKALIARCPDVYGVAA